MRDDVRCFAVVPTYNRPVVAEQCVRALLDQTAPLAGVVLVENAEQPQFAGQFDDEPRVEVVRTGKNLGSAGGFAFGIEVALERGATHVMLVDDDCMLAADVLEILLAQLEKTPNAIVGPISTVDGKNLMWTAHPRTGVQSTVADLPNEPFSIRGFPFHGMLIKAEHIRAYGGPRADFFVGAEDVELCRRYSSHGLQFIVCPVARAQHHAPPFRNFWLLGRRRVPQGTPGHRYYVLRNRLIIWRLYREGSLMDGVVLTFARELTAAFFGGNLLRRVGLLGRALRHGLIGRPSRQLPTDVPVFR